MRRVGLEHIDIHHFKIHIVDHINQSLVRSLGCEHCAKI